MKKNRKIWIPIVIATAAIIPAIVVPIVLLNKHNNSPVVKQEEVFYNGEKTQHATIDTTTKSASMVFNNFTFSEDIDANDVKVNYNVNYAPEGWTGDISITKTIENNALNIKITGTELIEGNYAIELNFFLQNESGKRKLVFKDNVFWANFVGYKEEISINSSHKIAGDIIQTHENEYSFYIDGFTVNGNSDQIEIEEVNVVPSTFSCATGHWQIKQTSEFEFKAFLIFTTSATITADTDVNFTIKFSDKANPEFSQTIESFSFTAEKNLSFVTTQSRIEGTQGDFFSEQTWFYNKTGEDKNDINELYSGFELKKDRDISNLSVELQTSDTSGTWNADIYDKGKTTTDETMFDIYVECVDRETTELQQIDLSFKFIYDDEEANIHDELIINYFTLEIIEYVPPISLQGSNVEYVKGLFSPKVLVGLTYKIKPWRTDYYSAVGIYQGEQVNVNNEIFKIAFSDESYILGQAGDSAVVDKLKPRMTWQVIKPNWQTEVSPCTALYYIPTLS